MAMVVLGVLLLALKLGEFGPVGHWSWWFVLAPFALAVVWWSWADSSGWTKKREMDKMDDRKRERRQKNLESLGLDITKRRDKR